VVGCGGVYSIGAARDARQWCVRGMAIAVSRDLMLASGSWHMHGGLAGRREALHGGWRVSYEQLQR